MQLKTLEYLIALEQAGSINKAAKGLYISQQGLRHTLDALEAELGVPLFTRSKQGIEPTAAGRIALAHAEAIVAEGSSLKRDLAELRLAQAMEGEADSELIVAPYASMTLLAGLLEQPGPLASVPVREWSNKRIHDVLQRGIDGDAAESAGRREHPCRRLFLFDWLSTQWPAALCDGRIATPCEHRGAGGTLVIETLFESRLGLVYRTDTPHARAGSATLADIEDMPLVCFAGRDYLSTIDAAWPGSSIANRTLSVSDTSTLLAYLSRNEGAGLIADELSFVTGKQQLQAELGFSFVPFRDASTLCVGMAYVSEGHDDTLDALAAYLRTTLA